MDALDRLRAVRADALAHGDLGLVRECDAQLARHGFEPETTEARPGLEATIPAKPKRPRK